MLPFQRCVGHNWQFFPWLGELGSKFALARVEGVGGDLYDRGFERLRYERRSSSILPAAIASTSTASTALFLHLPSTSCFSLLAHYYSITMGNPLFVLQTLSDRDLRSSFFLTMGNYLFVSHSPSDRVLRSSFIFTMGNSLFVNAVSVRRIFAFFFSLYDGKFPIHIAVSVRWSFVFIFFPFFVISVNAWWRILVCATVSLWWSSVFVVVSFIY